MVPWLRQILWWFSPKALRGKAYREELLRKLVVVAVVVAVSVFIVIMVVDVAVVIVVC